MEQMPQNREDTNNVEQQGEKNGFLNKVHKVLRAGVVAAVVGGAAASPAKAQEAPYDSGSTPDYSTAEYNYKEPAPTYDSGTPDSGGYSTTDTSYNTLDGKYILTPIKDALITTSIIQALGSIDRDRQIISTQSMQEVEEVPESSLRAKLGQNAKDIQEMIEGKKNPPLLISDPTQYIKKVGEDTVLKAVGAFNNKEYIQSTLAESARNIEEIIREKNPPLIINDPAQNINKTAHDVTSQALGTVNNNVVPGELDQSVNSVLDRLSKIGQPVTRSAIPPELAQQIMRSLGSKTEPSQILQQDEITLMKQHEAIIGMVQEDLNKSLEKELTTFGKGNVTLEFASLNPDTKKIFIKFASGGEISVEANMAEFNNKHLLQQLVEATVKEEILLMSAPGGK